MPVTGTNIKLKSRFDIVNLYTRISNQLPWSWKLLIRYKLLFFFVVLSLQPFDSSSQVLGEPVRITTQNGLPHDICYEVNQDSQGYIWIGTEYGAARYNGRKFRTFTTHDGLHSNYVIGLVPIRDGVAMATWGGGFDAVINEKVLPGDTKMNGVRKTNYIAATHKNFFLGVGAEFYQISAKSEQGPNSQFYIYKEGSDYTIQRKKDKIKRGVKARIVNVMKKSYLVYDPVEYPISYDDLYGIYKLEDESGDLSIAPAFPFLKGQALSFVGKHGKDFLVGGVNNFFICTPDQLLEEVKINQNIGPICKALAYREGYVLMTRDVKGNKHGYYYARGKLFDLHLDYHIKYSLSDIFIDHEDNLWVSTYGDGLYLFPEDLDDRLKLGPDILEDPNILDMAQRSDGWFFLLSRNYLYTLDTTLTLKSKIKLSNLCKEVNIRNGKPELVCVDSKTAEKQERDFKQIFGFQNTYLPGLGYVNADEGTVTLNGKRIYYDKTNTVQIQSFAFDPQKKVLYFADYLNFYVLNITDNSIVDSLNMKEQFCGDRINKVVVRNGEVWIATNQCLHLWKDKTIERIDTDAEAIEGPVNDLLLDQNELFVATLDGVYICKNNSWYLLNKKTGLISDYVKNLELDKNHRLWVAGVNGISVVKLHHLIQSGLPVLNIKQTNCQFDVDVISFIRPESIQLQYSLDDKKFIDALSGPLTFCNASHGEHSIRFRTRKTDSAWVLSKAYSFNIYVPWYKRDWGLLILVTTVLLLFSSFIFWNLVKSRKRNQQLQQLIFERSRLENELNEARSNIAKDFHDDMGNKMARISILAELLSQSKPGDETMKSRLEQVRNDAGDLYKSTRDFIWALKPEHNRLSALIIYLTDFGQDYFDSLGIDFETSSNVEVDIEMPYMANRNIIMIAKEAMANAIKHSACTLFKMKFDLQPGLFTIEWADNGISIPEEMESSLRGIANMKERAKKLGGQLSIMAARGTTIRLVFPLDTTRMG